jgi:hypothetical protein
MTQEEYLEKLFTNLDLELMNEAEIRSKIRRIILQLRRTLLTK